MSTVNIIFRFLHILGAVIGLGGLFMALVTLPRVPEGESRELLARQMGKWIGIALVVAVIAGGYNLSHALQVHTAPAYLNALWIKVILGLVVFVLSLLVFHPAAAFEEFRAKRPMWLALLVLLGLIVVALGAWLHSFYGATDARAAATAVSAP